MERLTGLKLGKEYEKAAYHQPVYSVCRQRTSCNKHAGLEESQAGIKIAGRNVSNLIYAQDATLLAESERN